MKLSSKVLIAILQKLPSSELVLIGKAKNHYVFHILRAHIIPEIDYDYKGDVSEKITELEFVFDYTERDWVLQNLPPKSQIDKSNE